MELNNSWDIKLRQKKKNYFSKRNQHQNKFLDNWKCWNFLKRCNLYPWKTSMQLTNFKCKVWTSAVTDTFVMWKIYWVQNKSLKLFFFSLWLKYLCYLIYIVDGYLHLCLMIVDHLQGKNVKIQEIIIILLTAQNLKWKWVFMLGLWNRF